MQYGDGNSTYRPIVSLDVSAHEFGHGITQFTANLIPGTQESGALNEGFSDIWAACVEHWAAPNKQTWRIGEELFTTTYNCIRDLQYPKSTYTSEGQHPDTYKGSYWDNNGEAHTNSTVLSHWFFLLSQGGTGTNDKANLYNVTGIGIENAQLIAYRAESMYLNSSATYTDAMNTTIQSARELFGNCSPQAAATINAWYAVGLGVGFAPITTASITARKTSATGEPTSYEYTATPYLGATYRWYVSGMANNPQQTDLINVFDWYFPCKTTKSVYCTVSNYCNSATSNSIAKTGECTRLNSFIVSPNPATNTVTISTIQNTSIDQTAISTTFDDVRIYDQQGNVKKYQKNNKTRQTQIYTSDLISGVYTIEITDGTYKERQVLIIQK